jgi:hypothetical protein
MGADARIGDVKLTRDGESMVFMYGKCSGDITGAQAAVAVTWQLYCPNLVI